MNNNRSLNIVVAEASVIIRCGLSVVLKRLPNMDVHPVEVTSAEALSNYANMHQPDVIIINPTFDGGFNPTVFRAAHACLGQTRYVALLSSVITNNQLKEYDDHFSICDELDVIASKLYNLTHIQEEEAEKGNDAETLSQREKEIITCVVKGMTNKAIADKLYLSIHTVITHRRNIARKLQIHSPAGLTIYAIVNKLVELSDIKDNL